MPVKLYEGCWGVTRGGEVVGPITFVSNMEWPWQDPSGCWYEDGSSWIHREAKEDVVAVFPTESAARAYVERKSWRKATVSLIRAIWKNWWTALALGLLLGYGMWGCTSTEPVPPACTSQAWNDSLNRWEDVKVGCDTVRSGGLGTGVRK